MNGCKNLTRNQHYIPQVYLRGFSPEYMVNERNVSKDKFTIYQHSVEGTKQVDKPVPIKSICYEKDFYEITGKDGETVWPNFYEKFFGEFEKRFGEYRRRLEQKVFYAENYKTKCFLTGEEKVFWTTYIIIQMLRSPQILGLAEETAVEVLDKNLTKQQQMNIARVFCLPFYKELSTEAPEMGLINKLFGPMQNMYWGVGVDSLGRIITSDKTVFICSSNGLETEYDKVIFPVSAQICLFLFGNEQKEKNRKNYLFPLVEEDIEEIVKSMSVSANEKIYANHLMSRQELLYIMEIMKDRERGD